MFIGERTNNNINIDTDKLAEDIASKINIPSIDPTAIVNPINTNTIKETTTIKAINNEIKKTVDADHTNLSDLSNYVINTATHDLKRVLDYEEYYHDVCNWMDFNYGTAHGAYYYAKCLNIKQPDIIGQCYDTWEVYKNNVLIDSLPIKITFFKDRVRIKTLKLCQLFNGDRDPKNQCQFTLTLKNRYHNKHSSKNMLEYYNMALLNAYPNDGSNNIPFPIEIYDNSVTPPIKIPHQFHLYDNGGVEADYAKYGYEVIQYDICLRADGFEGNAYQAILPQTIDTKIFNNPNFNGLM